MRLPQNLINGYYLVVAKLRQKAKTKVNCTVNRINDRSSDLMFEVGHRAIAKFGEQVSQGDEVAADTLGKMAPGVDGITMVLGLGTTLKNDT